MIGCKVQDCPWHRQHHELCSKDIIIVGPDGMCDELSNGKGGIYSKAILKERYDAAQKVKSMKNEAKTSAS